LIGQALSKARFETVETKIDLGIAEFRQALRRFQSQANGAEVALVYFAGHGIEANGANWLIPTDAELSEDRDLDYEAIKADLVLQALQGARMRVLVLDACRDNPFGRNWRASIRSTTSGLAKIEADDVLVLFAAAPGRTASDGSSANSPFAEALAKRLPEPGLAIQLLGGNVRDDVLAATGGNQRPYVSASITGKPFFLVPGERPPVETKQAPPPQPQGSEAEGAWDRTKDTTNIALLEAFMARFKNTYYADLARARIDDLKRQQAAILTPAPAKPEPNDEIAWKQVDSNDPAQLLRFIAQFPASSHQKEATFHLAYAYAHGEHGLRVDAGQARHWYRKAADLGAVGAMINLAQLLEGGRGGPRDYAEARRLYTTVAQMPNASEKAKRLAAEGLARLGK
jgi:TPR repeat protein